MKTRYILLAFAALAASACAKDAMQDAQTERIVTITAWQEGAAGTRTALQEAGSQVYWQPGDAIKVFYAGTGSRFEAQCTGLATVSDFVGSMNVLGGGNEGAQADKVIWGLYPYRVDATSDGSSVSTTLPSNQNGLAGSFDQNTLITVARSENFGLAFYNVCGGLRFSVGRRGQ